MANRLRCTAELGDAASVVRDWAEGVHGKDVRRGHEHAHGGHSGPEDSELRNVFAHEACGDCRLLAEPVRCEDRNGDGDRGHQRGLKAHRGTRNDVRCGARAARLCELTNWAVRTRRIELGDVDEGNARCEANDTSAEEVEPGVSAACLQHHCTGDCHSNGRKGRGDPVAAIEHVHWILILAAVHEEHCDDRAHKPEGADNEWEEDPGLWVRPASCGCDRVRANAQDHRADVLSRC